MVRLTEYATMKNQIENLIPELRTYAMLLIENGYDIAIHQKSNCSWIIFGISDNIGHCQYDRMSGFSFSTVHKPCKEYGTGFRVTENISNATIKDAELVFQKPSWANGSIVKRYDNLEDYVKSQKVLKYEILCTTN